MTVITWKRSGSTMKLRLLSVSWRVDSLIDCSTHSTQVHMRAILT